jgi:hypothetical protein
MSSAEIKLGDRVRLNELGISRCPRIRIRNGVVVALSGHNSRSASLGILFAGNKRATLQKAHRCFWRRHRFSDYRSDFDIRAFLAVRLL